MVTPHDEVAETARYLTELLDHRKAYRSKWERRVRQRTADGFNQAAVARVIAEYLVESGERADTEKLDRQIKDRVARLFSGKSLSTETLEWFISAFDMTDDHAERLRSIFKGRKGSGYVAGKWPPATDSMTDQGLRSLSLHELHAIGPDGRPVSHRTVQVVRATADSVAGYLYRFDTTALAVHVARGGKAGPIIDLGNGMHAMEITFNRPLAKGETCSLEYQTSFRYPTAPPPEFRRGVINRLDNLEVRVQFDSARIPSRIWWGSWESLEGPMAKRQPVELDAELSVHRYLDGVEAAIVGFAWEWQPG